MTPGTPVQYYTTHGWKYGRFESVDQKYPKLCARVKTVTGHMVRVLFVDMREVAA
jgi:hypothetical protein